MQRKTTEEQKYQGIGVSPGVARGTIYVYRMAEEVVPEYDLQIDEVAGEIVRFEEALIATRRQLHEIQERIAAGTGSAAPSSIIDVHLSLTEDPALIEPVTARVAAEKKNVEYIFREVATKYTQTLSELSDEYFRERAADIRDVSSRVLRNLMGQEHRLLTDLPADTIVIAYDLGPTDTTSLDREHVIGFATDVGSHTSHTAIVARSMNLPAVVGLHDVSQHVHDGQQAILDGYSGTLIVEPTRQTLFVYGQLESKRHSIEERLASLRDLPAETTDGHRVVVSGNIELANDVPALKQVNAEGIGLFRTEFLYLNRKDFPSEDEQFATYREVAEAMAPHPVIIRTLDLGGDKFHSEAGTPPEINPFLGFRGIRYCLANPAVFETQLRAILRVSAEHNVQMMYPMISEAQEIVKAKEVVERVKQSLRDHGVAFNEQIKAGAMIEVPSAALTAEIIAGEVDFFSIGSNDLVQYTMAVDRVNEKVADLYQPTHPAILRLIRSCVESAHNNGIWCGVCGEMAGDPLYVPLLIGMGVDELSVGAANLSRVKEITRRLSYAEAQELAANSLHAQHARDVVDMLTALVRRIDPDLID